MRRKRSLLPWALLLSIIPALMTVAQGQDVQPIPKLDSQIKTTVVYLDEMQKPDVLEWNDSGKLSDETPLTDRVVYAQPNETKRISVIWSYAYHRIPITRVSESPTFESRDLAVAPLPAISNLTNLVDPVTGKWIGIVFDVLAPGTDSWQCNVQAECVYFNAVMGRTYKHRRVAYFTFSTQPEMSRCLERIASE